MRELYFDVWAGDDLLGTSLGELTDAGDKKITQVDNGLGSGEFTISRHSDQYAWVTPGPTTPEPLIRCRRIPGGPFGYNDGAYIHAFFVEEGDDVLTSPDEEGGEDATRSGRSLESILDRAIVNEVATYSDDIVNHPYDKTTLKDGQWHMDEDIPGSFSNAGTPGAVLRIFLRNAGSQTPEPIPELTHDFNINNDTDGDPWPDGDAKWSFDVGDSLLTVLGILVNGGLFYEMRPDFLLSAYGVKQGDDLSGSITLRHAEDIATSGNRTIHASPAKSRLLVKGQTEDGVRTFRWVADTGIESVLGVRQGSLDYQATPTPAILDKAGQKKLADLKAQHDGPPTMGVDEVEGQEAFDDYFPGDTVAVDIPGVYEEEAARIHSITLQETETGEVDVLVEFNGEAWSGIEPPLTATAEAHDEFWTDAGLEGNAHEVMRMRDFGTDFYFQMGASHGTPDEDAYVSLIAPGSGQSAVDIFAYSESMGTYAEAIFEGGDLVQIVSGLWEVELDGTDDTQSKAYFNGGFGIVITSAETDDDPPTGEAGQIIYRNSSNSFRWHDGSAWNDFGTGTLGPIDAADVTYDPTASGLTATDVQAAIDELAAAPAGDQFDEDPDTISLRFKDGFSQLGMEAGDSSTGPDAYFSTTPGGPGASMGAFDSTGEASVNASVIGLAAKSQVALSAEMIVAAVTAGSVVSKHYLTGGVGLVVPQLASDPDGSHSEGGQVYFNTGSQTFRGYDGTVWGELALT